MGGNNSVERKTAEDKTQAENARSNAAAETAQKLDTVVENICNAKTSNAITNQDFITAIAITETAKTQLNREGDALTKADLIAIIIALNPKYIPHLSSLQTNTIKDLNVLIRTIVYDPSKYVDIATQSNSAAVSTTQPKMLENKGSKRGGSGTTTDVVVKTSKKNAKPVESSNNLFNVYSPALLPAGNNASEYSTTFHLDYAAHNPGSLLEENSSRRLTSIHLLCCPRATEKVNIVQPFTWIMLRIIQVLSWRKIPPGD